MKAVAETAVSIGYTMRMRGYRIYTTEGEAQGRVYSMTPNRHLETMVLQLHEYLMRCLSDIHTSPHQRKRPRIMVQIHIFIAEILIHSLVMVCACHNSTYSYTLHIYPTTASTRNIMRMPLDQDWCLYIGNV